MSNCWSVQKNVRLTSTLCQFQQTVGPAQENQNHPRLTQPIIAHQMKIGIITAYKIFKTLTAFPKLVSNNDIYQTTENNEITDYDYFMALVTRCKYTVHENLMLLWYNRLVITKNFMKLDMFDWLYKSAGKSKKYFYFAGGIGVVVTTVIGSIPKAWAKTAAWIANLCSVVFRCLRLSAVIGVVGYRTAL